MFASTKHLHVRNMKKNHSLYHKIHKKHYKENKRIKQQSTNIQQKNCKELPNLRKYISHKT